MSEVIVKERGGDVSLKCMQELSRGSRRINVSGFISVFKVEKTMREKTIQEAYPIKSPMYVSIYSTRLLSPCHKNRSFALAINTLLLFSRQAPPKKPLLLSVSHTEKNWLRLSLRT